MVLVLHMSFYVLRNVDVLCLTSKAKTL